MGSQAAANKLNACIKLDVVAGAMSPAEWDVLAVDTDAVARAAQRIEPHMNIHWQGVANTLNALCKLDAAASAMSLAGWDAVARAAERTAPTMNAQDAANNLNALSKLDSAASVMSPVE
jgi:hypothetical protein